MKLVQDYNLMKALNKLIRSGKLPRPVINSETFFDMTSTSFTIQCPEYDLSLYALKRTSSVYPDSHTILLEDPQHKLSPKQDDQNTRMTEKNTVLARMVFNRLERFYRKRR